MSRSSAAWPSRWSLSRTGGAEEEGEGDTEALSLMDGLTAEKFVFLQLDEKINITLIQYLYIQYEGGVSLYLAIAIKL